MLRPDFPVNDDWLAAFGGPKVPLCRGSRSPTFPRIYLLGERSAQLGPRRNFLGFGLTPPCLSGTSDPGAPGRVANLLPKENENVGPSARQIEPQSARPGHQPGNVEARRVVS
jgi:hypothetical protein